MCGWRTPAARHIVMNRARISRTPCDSSHRMRTRCFMQHICKALLDISLLTHSTIFLSFLMSPGLLFRPWRFWNMVPAVFTNSMFFIAGYPGTWTIIDGAWIASRVLLADHIMPCAAQKCVRDYDSTTGAIFRIASCIVAGLISASQGEATGACRA